MKIVLTVLLLTAAVAAKPQAISNTNLRYWYDPDFSGKFSMEMVRSADSVYTYFECDTTVYDVAWEKRDSYVQRVGDPVDAAIRGTKSSGWVNVRIPEKPWLLVAVLTDKRSQEKRIDFRQVEANYPPDGMLWVKNRPVFSHIPVNTKAVVTNTFGPNLKVFHYAERFPAGSPPFAEKERQVDPIMVVDSTFNLTSGQSVKFTREGLYLIQSDTNAVRGIAFRVAPMHYPKYVKVEDLSSSFVFISTKEEADKLKEAGPDKAKFDKVVLDIARDKERAKTLIRNYFRRVELANNYFTSYKEGWKTDRGMIYLVFGLPDEVNRNGGYEVWTYKNLNTKFTFVKTGSIFDPDYFVLDRNKRFSEAWYYTIDMWRKAQVASSVKN